MKIDGFNFVQILCSILKRDGVAFPQIMGQNPANHYFKPLSKHHILVLKPLFLVWQKLLSQKISTYISAIAEQTLL